MLIYKATNKINDKSYIGQTTEDLRRRRKRHECNKKGHYFHNSIRKHGKNNFVWETLEHCDSKEELNEMEFHYIKQYDTFKPNGYNLTYGGEGAPGKIVSKETRIKQSKAHLGKKRAPFSEEHKRRISESRMGQKNPNSGVPMPDHVKKLLSEINKNKIISDETRQKMSLAAKNRDKMSDETKAKISLARSKMLGDLHPLSKRYVIITPLKSEFVIHGIANFCKNFKVTKLSQANLVAVAKGKRKHSKNYGCRYYNEEEDKNLPTWRVN